jgi:hypothetical protein
MKNFARVLPCMHARYPADGQYIYRQPLLSIGLGGAMKQIVTIVFGLVFLAGCGTVATQGRPDSYYSAGMTANASQEGSLFSVEAGGLTDEQIRRILEYKYSAPPLNRVAILPIGRQFWFGWSDEFTYAGNLIQEQFISTLRSSPAIYDASYLPSMLVPEKRTVPHLREAAARYQADLLLIYRTSCRSFEKYRFFGTDRTKAYCTVETALLDTRTGIVPFTIVATRNYEAKETPEDTNFRETILKGQLKATGDALSEVATGVVEFIGKRR